MRLEMGREDFVKLMYERVDMETLFDVFSNSLSQTEDFVFVEDGERFLLSIKKWIVSQKLLIGISLRM